MSKLRERRSGGGVVADRRARRPQLERMEPRALLATIVVTGTGDTIANDGLVMLREAITAANTNAVSGDALPGSVGLDTIAFNIPGVGVHTITLLSDLPTITEPIVINGYTQPGSSPNTNPVTTGINAVPLIQLSSRTAGFDDGLVITAGSSTVRGLVISDFMNGIVLQTNGGNTIAGNFIGTNPTGTTAASSQFGVRILNSSNNIIGGTSPGDRNLLVGRALGTNLLGGAAIRGAGAAGLVVQGNFIGTDVTGTRTLVPANSSTSGVGLDAGAGSSVTIGGTAAGARNLISGNPVTGIELIGYSGSVIQGNFIGTDVTGTAKLGNGSGVSLAQGQGSNTVGGTAAGAGNVIAGSSLGAGLRPLAKITFTIALQLRL